MTSFQLAHTLVTAPGARPSKWMLVLHGILGAGANLRGLARRLAAARPAWGFVLVDLRMHGHSQGAPPPHTLAAASRDVVELERSLALPIHGALGHSFGGKVALSYAASRRGEGELDELWVLDSPLGARAPTASVEPTSAVAVLAMLKAFPARFPSREAFIERVVEAGRGRAVADWLAMNLRHEDAPAVEDGFRFGLDLGAIDALLQSYAATDLWPAVERVDGTRHLHVVVADRSDAFDQQDRARLQAIASRDRRVGYHLVPNAGHWVHVDAADALFNLVSASLA